MTYTRTHYHALSLTNAKIKIHRYIDIHINASVLVCTEFIKLHTQIDRYVNYSSAVYTKSRFDCDVCTTFGRAGL